MAAILDRYMSDLQAGKEPDRSRLLADNPELASQLEACLAGIDFVHNATGSGAQEWTTLGEFRILREIGRGGMGVVYEAEQTSLRRRVALKVMRFGAVEDPEAIQRFLREAETVARLHHTNIVPIFAVGSERGVHFYAMQFIEGKSLAEVLAESQRAGKPLACADVTGWGLQAAEALAHAHLRGVVHRDIKPSNLLGDPEGIVWLTDFGLAKRADLATLTVRGALMGTPRYMSPEQAESIEHRVDRRTDLYSLGASLYELATGRPVFESAEPHLVIAQILNDEPIRPRQIRRDLPRDLETIILTCLSKEPGDRYQTASALADDLRSVLAGRPIRARRTTLSECVVRFIRKRRKALGVATRAVAATVLLIAGAALGWRSYADWRSGGVILTTDGPSLTAQVFAETGDEPVGEPFDVGRRTPLSLAAGDYRLRLNAPGLLGQTYRFAVNRGEVRTHRLTLDDEHAFESESLPYASESYALELAAGKGDIIEWNCETLIRRDGATAKVIWNARQPAKPWSPKLDPVDWLHRLSYYEDPTRPGDLVQPAPDLDRDGTNDLVWAIHGTPSFLALSGKDGSMLWTFSADPAGLGGPDPDGPRLPRSPAEIPRLGRIAGPPVLADVDRDGTPDLITEFVVYDDLKDSLSQSGQPIGQGMLAKIVPKPLGRRGVIAVSGRSGRGLWNYPLDQESTDDSQAARASDLALLCGRSGAFIMAVHRSLCISLDLATGRPKARPIDLGFVPTRPIQYADLDGDGAPELLALEPSKTEPLTSPTLAAFSLETGKRQWAEKLLAFYRPKPDIPQRNWPLVADLDSDGRAEVVVPDLGPLPPNNGALYGGVRMLDGAGAKTRWVRPLWPGMRSATDGLLHLLAAADLDNDGTRDIVVVSRFDGRNPYEHLAGQEPEPSRVYVDALSGKDGHPLWWWRTDVANPDSTPIRAPFWWALGRDAQPMLALAIGGTSGPGIEPTSRLYPSDPPVVHLLEATTGQESHTIPGLYWPKLADLDGDGIFDLWASVDGKLRAFRGERPEAWRALGRFDPAGDLDGDGLDDVITSDLSPPTAAAEAKAESRTIVARSGRDGRMLWRTRLDPWEGWTGFDPWPQGYTLKTFPPPRGDFDGDGTQDVLVIRSPSRGPGGSHVTLPLRALAGRTGELLWSAMSVPPLGFQTHGDCYIEGIDVCADNAESRPDVLVVYDTPFRSGGPTSPSLYQQSRLVKRSGRDGRIIWDVLLVEHTGGMSRLVGFTHEFGDLDGDGSVDVVLLLPTAAAGATPFELRALSLRDGKTLWAHPTGLGVFNQAVFSVGDLDGDGRDEVVVRNLRSGDESPTIEVVALEGPTGANRWAWHSEALPVIDASRPRLVIGLADFEGKARHDVCLNFEISTGRRRVVILDDQGRQKARRDLTTPVNASHFLGDLNGDGREDLLLPGSEQLHALRGDLKELWSRPWVGSIREVVPAGGGQPATVVFNKTRPSTAAGGSLSTVVGIDGATGHSLWSGGRSLALVSNHGESGLPRTLSGAEGATVCRVALPTSADGALQPPPHPPSKPAPARDDPRWLRPLPWVDPVPPYAHPLAHIVLAAVVINVAVPLAIFWLATRGRVWSVRLLLALPAMVAIPMAGFSTLQSMTLRAPDNSPVQMFLAITLVSLAGVPILAYSLLLGSALLRGRWRRLGWVIGETVLAAAIIAFLWLWSDGRLATKEHYTYTGWYHVGWWGVYLVGLVAVLTRPVRGGAMFAWRLPRRVLAARRSQQRRRGIAFDGTS